MIPLVTKSSNSSKKTPICSVKFKTRHLNWSFGISHKTLHSISCSFLLFYFTQFVGFLRGNQMTNTKRRWWKKQKFMNSPHGIQKLASNVFPPVGGSDPYGPNATDSRYSFLLTDYRSIGCPIQCFTAINRRSSLDDFSLKIYGPKLKFVWIWSCFLWASIIRSFIRWGWENFVGFLYWFCN